MSFAAGFQAGSGAVERGLRLRAMREEKEKQEAFEAAAAGLSDQYKAGQQQVAQYGLDQQANLDAGMALASPVPPSGNSANALLANAVPGAMGTQGAQMSPVAPQAGGLSVPGAAPQAAYMTPPEAMSYTQYQRGLADLAMQYGDTNTALTLMSAAEAADRNERLEAMRRSEFAQDYALRVNADARAEAQETRAAAEAEREVEAYNTGLQNTKDMQTVMGMIANRDKISDISSFVQTTSLDANAVMQTVQTTYGIMDAEIEQRSNEIREKVSGMTLSELLKAHKEDENISPGEHYDVQKNEDTGLWDIQVIDTETGNVTQTLGSHTDIAKAENTLRTMAFDRTTALESLATEAAARRSASAKQQIEKAKVDADNYATTQDTREALLGEIAALEKDPMFQTLTPAQQEGRIKGLFEVVGVPFKPEMETLGNKGEGGSEGEGEGGSEGEGEGKPLTPRKAAEAVMQQQRDAEQAEDAFRDEVDYVYEFFSGGLTGLGRNPEAFKAAYDAASPEVRAAVDEKVAQFRARQDARAMAREFGLQAR